MGETQITASRATSEVQKKKKVNDNMYTNGQKYDKMDKLHYHGHSGI